MDTTIVAALISGVIAVLGVIASLTIARWQLGVQKKS